MSGMKPTHKSLRPPKKIQSFHGFKQLPIPRFSLAVCLCVWQARDRSSGACSGAPAVPKRHLHLQAETARNYTAGRTVEHCLQDRSVLANASRSQRSPPVEEEKDKEKGKGETTLKRINCKVNFGIALMFVFLLVCVLGSAFCGPCDVFVCVCEISWFWSMENKSRICLRRSTDHLVSNNNTAPTPWM